MQRNLSSEFDNANEPNTRDGQRSTEPPMLDEETKKTELQLRRVCQTYGEIDEGAGCDSEELAGDQEAYGSIDEDGSPEPELLSDASLLNAAEGVGQIAAGNVNRNLLKDMVKRGWASICKSTPYGYLMEPYEPRPTSAMETDYPTLYKGEYGPTSRALEAAVTPSGAFFYFVQPALWEDIAKASNEYFSEKLEERVEGIYDKQILAPLKKPTFQCKLGSGGSQRSGMETTARHRRPPTSLSGRIFSTTYYGIRRGHAAIAVKLQSNESVHERLTPSMGYEVVHVLLFYDCVLFEVYCGKQENPRDGALTYYDAGPAAVVRNLREVFGPSGPETGSMRVIVTDRFYISVPLALQLLTMGFYSIGTIQTDRLGLPVSIVGDKKEGEKKKKKKPPKNRPKNIERGTFEVTAHLQVPGLRVLRWWDNKAIYMLAFGGSVEFDRVVRCDKLSGEQTTVACPRVLKDYQTLMGSVDVHDQLRLQRYSLQLAIKYKKYYKSLFLGLIDLAAINPYVIHNARRAADGMRKLNHVKFLKKLHLELRQLRDDDWVSLLNPNETTPSKSRTKPPTARHLPVQNDEWRPGNNQTGRKRRTRVCKVCSLLKDSDDIRDGDSSIYCSDCKLTTTSKQPKAWRVFLYDKARRKYNGVSMTRFDIWHRVWKNSTLLPTLARKRKIRARTPAEDRTEGAGDKETAFSSDESSRDDTISGAETEEPHPPKRTRARIAQDEN
ncbi:unnamed protein product [Phytophthora fragariaefolia]|uniref:Unnamed protein product n=1 Tax=Phytophthora fragariaefolia TaxID=1490495 RepID=A0A9W7D5Y1_9STRA|nr:unnamed protein product [Phytophthora fragariaefolia]